MLAFHSAELTGTHEYSKKQKGRGHLDQSKYVVVITSLQSLMQIQAQPSSFKLQARHNPPVDVGIVIDGFRVVFVEYIVYPSRPGPLTRLVTASLDAQQEYKVATKGSFHCLCLLQTLPPNPPVSQVAISPFCLSTAARH